MAQKSLNGLKTLRIKPLLNDKILDWSKCNWLNWMVFYPAFNSILVISWQQLTLFLSFLGFTSTRLGFELSCPRTLPQKNPEDPVRLEPRTPGLQVKHFTTELCGTPSKFKEFVYSKKKAQTLKFFCNIVGKKGKCWLLEFCPFSTRFSYASFSGSIKPQ